ncbi:MAG TPA: MFS transporter [Chitinophagaceae bacterium]|nr:MFS transporter [Chitinophagaceae bacterium]
MTRTKTIPASRLSVRIAVKIFFFIAGCCFASWASRIPAIQQKLGLNNAALGGVLLALPVGLMTSLPVSGWMVSRLGSRRVVILAAFAYTSILPLLGLAARPWQLVVTLYCFGFAGNLFNISVNTQAIGTERLYKRSIMASFHGVWSLAGFSGAAMGTLMVSRQINPFFHFCLVSGLLWIALLLAFRYLLVTDPPHEGGSLLFARPDPFLLRLGLIAFCCMICEGAMFDWSGVYFKKQVTVPDRFTTLGYVAFMSAMAGGRFLGDRLAEWMGKKRMIQVSGIVIACGLLIAVLFPVLVPATLGLLLVGFGVSSVVPLVYGSAGRYGKMNAGVAIAAVSTIGYFGFLFGPPLIGFIAQATSLRVSFLVIALLGFCTFLLATWSRIES